MEEDFEVSGEDDEVVEEVYEIWDKVNERGMVEGWDDGEEIGEEWVELLREGIVDLKSGGEIEGM